MRIFRQSEVITSDNCHRVAKHNLVMPGDVAFGVKAQFENEAMTAVRLSHFLSNFLQVHSRQFFQQVVSYDLDLYLLSSQLLAE